MTKKFKTLNRALSLLLAVIMVIGIVPVTALANSGAIPTGDPAPVVQTDTTSGDTKDAQEDEPTPAASTETEYEPAGSEGSLREDEITPGPDTEDVTEPPVTEDASQEQEPAESTTLDAITKDPGAEVLKAEQTSTGPSLLSSLTIHTGYSLSEDTALLQTGNTYQGVATFDPDTYSYTLPNHTDALTQLRFRPVVDEEGATVTIYYYNGSKDDMQVVDSDSRSTWANCITVGKNTFTLVVKPPEGSTNTETTYTFTMECYPTLTNLALATDGSPLYLDPDFKPETTSYETTVLEAVYAISVAATPKDKTYTVTFNGATGTEVVIEDKTSIAIDVTAGESEKALTLTYTVALNKVKESTVIFEVDPKDAIVSLYDSKDATVYPGESGSYSLMAGAEYTYVVTKYGYVSQTKTFEPSEDTTETITLVSAPENALKQVDAEWYNFRNSDNNMAITPHKTPVAPEAELRWARKLGSGWATAPSVQILVDNSLVVMSSTKIYKLNKNTGETIAEADMVAPPNWGYTPPTYAEGMIFAPLAGGKIQAFDAETLESLWVSEPLGGQSLSPITYSDGYIYTGFWSSETEENSYVCISVTDEDPTKTDETKYVSWKHTVPGGFYWAGSLVKGDYVIFGSDDGTKGCDGLSKVYSLNKLTGGVVDALDIVGDQRSSIAYDETTDRIYFATKTGYLYSVKVKEDGTFDKTTLKSKHYEGWQSTSTPLVYKGRAYIGLGQGFGKGKIVVADSNTLEPFYEADLKGYPQCSMLLSTAYEDTEGRVYLYSTYNYLPGGITMLEDAPGQIEPKVTELYDAEGYSQYCIASIICDRHGTIFYKNDSANVLAVERNEAYLTNLTITGGNPAFDREFSANAKAYEVVVDIGTSSIVLHTEGSGEIAVNANGEIVESVEGSRNIPLVNGKADITITVAKHFEGGTNHTRTYSVLVREKSADATLSGLVINTANNITWDQVEFSPEFSPEHTSYISAQMDKSKSWFNIWPKLGSEGSSYEAKAIYGIDKMVDDGRGYQKVYFETGSGAATVEITVTAEDGVTQKKYCVMGRRAGFDTKYSVTFALTPETAEVTVKDSEGTVVVPDQSGTYNLPEGSYTYTVTANGYVSETGSFEVPKDSITGVIPVVLLRASDPGTPGDNKQVTVNLRIEGYNRTIVPKTSVTTDIFDLNPYVNRENIGGSAEPSQGWNVDKFSDPTVMHATVKALRDRGFSANDTISGNHSSTRTYDIQDYGWSLYIAMIGGDRELDDGGMSGWVYRVNKNLPNVGAQEYIPENGDEIVWAYAIEGFDTWYTEWEDEYISTQTGKETTLTLIGYITDLSGESGIGPSTSQPIEGATVYVDGKALLDAGGNPVTTGSNGQVKLTFNTPGTYTIGAEDKASIIRPHPASIRVTGEAMGTGGISTEAPESAVTAQAEIIADLDKATGIASAVLFGNVLDGFNKEIAAAQDKDNAEAIICVDVPAASAGIQVTIPVSTVEALEKCKDISLAINTGIGAVKLDHTSLRHVASEAKSGNIVISIRQASTEGLSESAKTLIGNYPAFRLSIVAGNTPVTRFGNESSGGRAAVSLPYTPKDNEDTDCLSVYYVGNDGTLEKMDDARYDAETKSVRFTTDHFSLFAIVSERVEFTDVGETHWAKEFIYYLANRGIVSGVGGGRFEPNRSITRAEFVKILTTAAKADISKAESSGFSDVAATAWYAPYIAWAAEAGIVKGYDGKFRPNDNIIRQDIAVMIARYAEYAQYTMPKTTQKSAFADDAEISAYAKDSVSSMQQAGIIIGKGENRFAPTDNATRAEACKMIAMLMQSREK